MTVPLLTELPYRPDSATLFEAVADRAWAVFLDSGLHYPGQARYDIIAAEPHVRLVTRGGELCLHGRLQLGCCRQQRALLHPLANNDATQNDTRTRTQKRFTKFF